MGRKGEEDDIENPLVKSDRTKQEESDEVQFNKKKKILYSGSR